MAKRYTGLNLAQTQPEDTIDFTGLGKGILAAEEFKYKEREKKKDQALELLKPQTTFHPYQAAADETLKGIYDGLLSKKDVDPLEVSRAAIEYNQQISLAKAVGESISGITQQYYQDPELNADVAAQMLKSKYIKDGSLPELYKISNQTLDGSFFLEEQGGSAALNVPLTLSNRLKTIGEITKKITTSGDWKKIPGLTGLAESEVITRMTQAANIVDVDTNGNIYIKDISSPHADTAIGAMLTDQRVSRIVDDALALAGIQQPTYDQRKEELRRQLAPYASYTSTDEQKKATTRYQTWDPRKTYPGPSGPGADYVANFQANILSGNTALIKDAVNYIRVAPDFNINSLPDQLATISLKDASGAPVLQNANDKSVVLDKISGSLVEVIDAKAEQGDPKLGLDPNQLYVKITIKGPPPFLEKFKWAQEGIDFHLPIEAFKNQTFTNFLYNAAKTGQGKDYGVLPSTVNVNQVYAPPGGFPQMALGGEIDVDTKYSDFKGTATVKDLIGGFSMGGYVSTSVRDLMKKGFNEGGTLPEYSAQAEEVTVTAEAPAWLKFKRDFLKENPFNISQYVEERVNQPQTGRAAYQAIDEQELRSKIRDQGKRQYEGKMYDYIQKKLVEVNPQAGRPRGEWLDSFSEKEQKILKQSPRFQPTYITDFKRSLQTAIEQNPTDAFRFIMDSKDYTTQEKKDMILNHIENPAIAKLADAAGIFAPLSMGSKVIQSAYRDDTTIESALMGIKNDASIIEDLITDVTTFIGPGTAAKIKNLMRIGKTKEAAKVIAQVADKLPAEAVEFIDDFAVKSQSAPVQPKPVMARPEDDMAKLEKGKTDDAEIARSGVPSTGFKNLKPGDLPGINAPAQATPATSKTPPIADWLWKEYNDLKEFTTNVLKKSLNSSDNFELDLSKDENLKIIQANLSDADYSDFISSLNGEKVTDLNSIVSFLFEKTEDKLNSLGIVSASDYINKSVKFLEKLANIYSITTTRGLAAYKKIHEYNSLLKVLNTKIDYIMNDLYNGGLDITDMDSPLSALPRTKPVTNYTAPTPFYYSMPKNAKNLINERFDYTAQDLEKIKAKYKDDFETLFGKNYDQKDLGLYAKLRDISEGKIRDVNLNQFNKWFLDTHGPKLDFTPEEEVIIDAYTWGHDSNINKRQPSPHKFYEDVVAPKLENIILKNQLKEDAKVMRRSHDFKATVERNGNRMQVRYSDMQPGDIYIPESFTSTSLQDKTLFGNIAAEINLPKGQSYLPAFAAKSNTYQSEAEILLPFDLKFRVMERSNGKNPLYKFSVENPYSLIPFMLLGGLPKQTKENEPNR